jgi:hypothetical protein
LKIKIMLVNRESEKNASQHIKKPKARAAYRCTNKKIDWGVSHFRAERISEELAKITREVKIYASKSMSEPSFVAKSTSETFQAMEDEKETMKARMESNPTWFFFVVTVE